MRPLRTAAAIAAAVALTALLAIPFFNGVLSLARAERDGVCLALDPSAPPSERAPGFELPDLDGKKRALGATTGRVVLLNFWATWCPPCVDELPSLIGLRRALASEKGFELLTVSVDESAAVVRKFLAGYGGPSALPVLMDPSKKVPLSFGTSKFPETYLLDRSGKVRLRFVNKRDWSSPDALACIRSFY
jgi:cytochrome c biogenesis protein CcmG, thiol:disulfide interchange protein DsbE